MINFQNYILIRVYNFLKTCAQPELCTKYKVAIYTWRKVIHHTKFNGYYTISKVEALPVLK